MSRSVAFPAECLGDILQHLSGSDLLRCTLVSPEWNYYIGSTRACMEKIQFNTWKCESFKDSLVPLTMLRRRKYQDIVMNERFFAERAILKHRVLCKRIQMNNFTLSIYMFRSILDALRVNTEELVLNSIKLTPSKYRKKKDEMQNVFFELKNECEVFTFDKLATLKITTKVQNFSVNYIRAPRLKVFHLTSEKIHRPYAATSIRDFLHTLPELRDLRINGKWFHMIFCEYTRDFPFQLDTMSLVKGHNPTDFMRHEGNFKKFLASQKGIRKFELNDQVGVETIEMIFRMETLKELTIRDCPFFIWVGLREKGARLQSLEYLDIVTLDCNCEDRIKTILSLFPGLKYLRMRSIRAGVARFIQGNLKQIQKIQLVHQRDALVDAVLPDVKWD